eukprot:11220261-Lingulodinium_polyedra.AAC.1
MRGVLGVAAAYQIACGIRWRPRYAISEVDPHDWDSRAADRGGLRSGERQMPRRQAPARRPEGGAAAPDGARGGSA